MANPAMDFHHLSISERIQLVEDIWDSIAEEAPELVALTEAQRKELDRREAAYQREPGSSVAWDAVRRELFDSDR